MKVALSKEIITRSIQDSLRLKEHLLNSIDLIDQIGALFVKTIQNGGTIFLFGNGGSAADSQHIAAELVGRFETERKGLPAVALTVNTSNITAIANDYGYEQIFSRQLEALLRKGDLVVALSTSGNSPNVLKGVEMAREKGCQSVGLTGESGGKLAKMVDHCYRVPATQSYRIQEIHILLGHILSEIVDEAFSGIH